jgi:hemin uptake protein HemP
MLICVFAHGQNLIGYTGNDILKYMDKNHKEMNLNNVVNNKFSYLKYSDSAGSETILFFLNHDSLCRSERIVCDKSLKILKMKELNSRYLKNGDNKWIDKHDGKTYKIELTEGEWSCIISIESEK